MNAGFQPAIASRQVINLTRDWGDWNTVSLYLDRCQVDTPVDLVESTWRHVADIRDEVGKVLDFGAGDARFAFSGDYREYVGYEIDADRCSDVILPENARLLNRCAFSDEIHDADVCIGNPPFVRNQDLPVGWREHAAAVLKRRTGVDVSGLANAWQYFFLLSLASVKPGGLCALVVPYEWVSRPSAKALREYIRAAGWSVHVYRLIDTTFASVLTTSSITIVDKADTSGTWRFYEETADRNWAELASESGSELGVLPYRRSADVKKSEPRASRGLSPGTQKVLTLTEGERARYGLKPGVDVVPCVTTLRTVPVDVNALNEAQFKRLFRDAGLKCWLINAEGQPGPNLESYLSSVPAEDYQTATCLERPVWWQFKMPQIPDMLMAQCFRGAFPKALSNEMRVRAVGGVCGLYDISDALAADLAEGFGGMDIGDRVVAHSHGLRKIEINQINALLASRAPADQQ